MFTFGTQETFGSDGYPPKSRVDSRREQPVEATVYEDRPNHPLRRAVSLF
jgi:hypothetical protein